MNFYKHHIGDYDQATRHLSFVEDAAYSRLIRKYYAEEKVFPADVKKIERLIGARTKEEREAVSTVLDEFFVLEADGWHNKRCDEELAEAQESESERDEKKANERERQKRHRVERKTLFEKLRLLDIVPAYDTPTETLRALLSQRTPSPVTRDESKKVTRDPETSNAPVTRTATANQTPDTRHQTPDSTSQTPDLKPETPGTVIAGGIAPRAASDDSTPKDAAEWLRYFRDRHGVELDATSLHDRKKAWPLFTAWVNAGVSIGQMDAAVAKAQAEAVGVIAFLPAYADRVLASLSRPATATRLNPDEHRRAISDANGAAWLAGGAEDPNVIDMES